MVVPYFPTPFATPVISPAVGGAGLPPLPYLSNSQYIFAPTAVDAQHLYPGGTPAQVAQSLADTVNRASRWADSICFGSAPSASGASLAASLSVEQARLRPKQGELRLVCDYRPILEVVGVDIGLTPDTVSSIGASSATIQINRQTIVVPWTFLPVTGRPNASAPANSVMFPLGTVYVVWAYVSGYPHTMLTANVTSGATSCEVAATNGNGGLWGVFPASGSFPGTALTVKDGGNTETVYVQGITTGSTTTTLTTTPFRNSHTVPAPPDFIPVTAIPADVEQAVISLTSVIVKVRGSRAQVMPQLPGTMATPRQRQVFAQAGALEDYTMAVSLLAPYRVRSKSKV
jgi:hypothetical protein